MTPLTESTAEDHLLGICFKIGPPRLVGVEAEWFVHDSRCPQAPVEPHRVAAALAQLPTAAEPVHPDPAHSGGEQPEPPLLPAGARLTREPGGQVELSSPPAEHPAACAEDLLRDQAELRAALAAQGLRLTGSGTDPLPRERRMQLDHPRYLAMEQFFDRAGPWGRIMMTGTASVQVNVDAGADSGPHTLADRWRLTHLLGPVLVAAFANSPLLDGKPTGYRSTRQLVWSRMDPSRTLAPAAPGAAATDPREDWARYVLDAELLCVRRPNGSPWTAPAGLTFRGWLRGAGERPPSLADLDYHRTTLFPPVRPRGHLELRMIDAQPGDGWLAPLALVTALLDDPAAADLARAALEPLTPADGLRPPRAELWHRAATLALGDPQLRRAALACFGAADQALARRPGSHRLRGALADFADRYPARGRCPADDQLDALRSGADPVSSEAAR
ncbi:ergothioneine biosynthesis glutamate--cysteine ligase EgtA [Kitasatospora sp. MAP5-34]|uniref:ergothioneine biosynthesis glutamate--cysteine ligase EgtA n=1 Tax=Kitasatospora sp. MAP5-34 TaxID=3035102 RepID=UPI0024731720|nr:ergothioneine biosynthesis glutamate--cysteine ligase EgtA [Kitasatospora sp. MAP5-34]MDH6575142.1 glutamate--cysteine ligase [Kitasatospora sp. MAP5-34]